MSTKTILLLQTCLLLNFYSKSINAEHLKSKAVTIKISNDLYHRRKVRSADGRNDQKIHVFTSSTASTAPLHKSSKITIQEENIEITDIKPSILLSPDFKIITKNSKKKNILSSYQPLKVDNCHYQGLARRREKLNSPNSSNSILGKASFSYCHDHDNNGKNTRKLIGHINFEDKLNYEIRPNHVLGSDQHILLSYDSYESSNIDNYENLRKSTRNPFNIKKSIPARSSSRNKFSLGRSRLKGNNHGHRRRLQPSAFRGYVASKGRRKYKYSKPQEISKKSENTRKRPSYKDTTGFTKTSIDPTPPPFFNRRLQIKQRRIKNRRKKKIPTLETFIVADKYMIEKHKNDNVTNYILTIMNVVSQLYQAEELKQTKPASSAIRILVGGVMLLEDDDPDLKIEASARRTLRNFCKWQDSMLKIGGRRPDHSILITGLDICAKRPSSKSWTSQRSSSCDTLGYSYVQGMCERRHSCTINEDSVGLGVAYTIAHEIGHSFGMNHDGDDNKCKSEDQGFLMANHMKPKNGLFKWSDCSVGVVDGFLNTNKARCLFSSSGRTSEKSLRLEISPTGLVRVKSNPKPNRKSGSSSSSSTQNFLTPSASHVYIPNTYSLDVQCRWQFGQYSTACSQKFDHCKELHCLSPEWNLDKNKCFTKFVPALQGTICDQEGFSWCVDGVCVKKPIHLVHLDNPGGQGELSSNSSSPTNSDIISIDFKYQWSEWGNWSSCSRSCEVGVITRTRRCKNTQTGRFEDEEHGEDEASFCEVDRDGLSGGRVELG